MQDAFGRQVAIQQENHLGHLDIIGHPRGQPQHLARLRQPRRVGGPDPEVRWNGVAPGRPAVGFPTPRSPRGVRRRETSPQQATFHSAAMPGCVPPTGSATFPCCSAGTRPTHPAAVTPETTILPKLWTVPDAIRNRLGREAGPQRAMLEEGHLLLILHQTPEPDEHGRKAALFWRQPSGEWRSNLGGLALNALQALLQSFDERLLRLESMENRANSAAEYHAVLEQLAPMLRAARGLHRALQQARDLMKSEHSLINFRDQAAAAERNAELLLQDAQFGLNFTVAKQAESQANAAKQMAVTAHRLNLLAAVFLPLTALASVFGMEIHSQFGDSPVNFWLICACGMLLGAALAGLLMRRA